MLLNFDSVTHPARVGEDAVGERARPPVSRLASSRRRRRPQESVLGPGFFSSFNSIE